MPSISNLLPNPFAKKIKIDWQRIRSTERAVPDLYRSPVLGGWLVSHGYQGGLTFVPDPEHKWDGESYPIIE